MANNNDAFTAMLLPQMMAQTQAMQQMAMRPQKSYATTTTTSTSTPYALADMIARRDSIGNASRALEDALKKREDLGYVLASSLGAIPQQQGYGSWLTDFARSLGGGMATPTNLEVDRAQKKYEADMADLQQALAFDKAMGETQTQKQTENIGYTGGGVAGGNGDLGAAQYTLLPDVDVHALNIGAGRWDTNKYDPQDKEQGYFDRLNVMAIPNKGKGDFGIAKERGDEDAKVYEKYETIAMEGMFDVLKALRPATDTDVLTALKSTGADPTMQPEVRDMRLTNTINKELAKSNLGGVKNLKNWYESVKLLKETGTWNPEIASKIYPYDKIRKESTRELKKPQTTTQNNTGKQKFVYSRGN